MRIESRAQLESFRARARQAATAPQTQVLVCCGTGCLASGAAEVADAFEHEVQERQIDVSVGVFTKRTGCHGFCERGPLVVLLPSGVLYTRVKPKNVPQIIEKTVQAVLGMIG